VVIGVAETGHRTALWLQSGDKESAGGRTFLLYPADFYFLKNGTSLGVEAHKKSCRQPAIYETNGVKNSHIIVDGFHRE